MEALKDVRILDMTHVQAGPTCSQLLAWMGADVIKFEPPQGDATRGQLRDVPNADSPVLHDAQLQQAVDHRQHEERRGQAGVRRPAEDLRHHDGELRSRRARAPGLHVGQDPRDQPEDRRRLDQGVWFQRPVRRVQGVRERRAGDGRLDEHHRRARRPAVRHRRADRRLGHRPAPGDRPAGRAAPGAPRPARASTSRSR